MADLEAHLAAVGTLAGCVMKDLDLRTHDSLLVGTDLTGAVFLGCRLSAAALDQAAEHRAVVFPPIEGVPFSAYRVGLYDPAELYAGFDPAEPGSWRRSLDARIDAWYRDRRPPDVVDALYQRLHDHALSDALSEVIAGRRVVGVMGGHRVRRDDASYRAVAVLGRALARADLLVATGGGPGAMEAANLGAFLAPHPDGALDDALAVLAQAPDAGDLDAWLASAGEVRARWAVGSGESIGIPTWHYGHEPPNPFASAIAKYFDNSVREDGLLTIAGAGLVVTPGGAGTVQEIFQDAAQNAYATPAEASPMVFFGTRFWSETAPVFPLLVRLAAGTHVAGHLLLTDDPDEVVAAVTRRPAPSGH